MRVLEIKRPTKYHYKLQYWLACPETGKLININRNGAFKVASVCNTEVETKTVEGLEAIKQEYKSHRL